MSAGDRTPFETFWIAKGAPPSSLSAIEDFARQRKREIREQRGLRATGFLPADAPMGAKTLFNQKRDLHRLAEIATAEGSAIEPGSWPDFVSVSESVGENVEALLDAGGRLPEAERRERRLTEGEADVIARERAIEFIVDICEEIDEAGEDGPTVLEMVVRGDPLPDLPGLDEDAIVDDLEEIEAEFGRDLVTDAIAACRDQLAGPADGEVRPTQELLDEFRERFGVTAVTPDQAFAELEERLQTAERAGQEAALNRLERGFGQRFDSLDEAIDRLRERIATARGERLRIADLEVRRVGDEIRVRVDTEGLTMEEEQLFRVWRDNAERRIRRELDLGQLPSPSPWVTVGEMAVRGEDLDFIDLTEGRERLGEVAEPEPLPEERPAREQAELPEAETEPEQLAQRAIDVLER